MKSGMALKKREFTPESGSVDTYVIFLLHVALSISSTALVSVQYFSCIVSILFFVVLSSSFLICPQLFLIICSSSLLITCPYHFCCISVIFLEACATLVVPRMCSFLILSLRVTPHIHRSILISFTSIRFSHLFIVAHVSAPYTIVS